LDDKDGFFRGFVCETLGDLGDRRAVEPLLDKLNDSDYWVRKAACQALGDLGDKRAVEPLRRLAENDSHKEVRFAAKSALERLESETENTGE